LRDFGIVVGELWDRWIRGDAIVWIYWAACESFLDGGVEGEVYVGFEGDGVNCIVDCFCGCDWVDWEVIPEIAGCALRL